MSQSSIDSAKAQELLDSPHLASGIKKYFAANPPLARNRQV